MSPGSQPACRPKPPSVWASQGQTPTSAPDRGHAAAWLLRPGSHGIGGRGSGSALGSAGGSTGGPRVENTGSQEPPASEGGGPAAPAAPAAFGARGLGAGRASPGASVFGRAGGVAALAGAERDAMPPPAPRRPRETIWEKPKGGAAETHSLPPGPASVAVLPR